MHNIGRLVAQRLVRTLAVVNAEFGGFLGRKLDGHPGPKAIWKGMQKVRAFAIALEAGRIAYFDDG
jgi:hypothetical protein